MCQPAVSRWWCPSHGSGSSRTHITRTEFTYDEQSDSFTCPQGQTLHFRSYPACEWSTVASVPGLWCRLSGVSSLRSVYEGQERLAEVLAVGPHDAVLRRHRAWMATSAAKQAYKLRKQLVEPVFGIIKEQQGARRFLLRGLVNVAAEWTVLATVRYAPAHHRVRQIPPSSRCGWVACQRTEAFRFLHCDAVGRRNVRGITLPRPNTHPPLPSSPPPASPSQLSNRHQKLRYSWAEELEAATGVGRIP